MKSIFITSFHPLISRNIIATNIISLLKKNGGDIVVLTPDYKKDYFVRTYGHLGIIIEGVDIGTSIRTLRMGIFKRLAEATPHTKRAAIGRRRTLSGGKKSSLYYFLFYLPAGIMGRSLLFIRFARFLDYLLSPRGRFYALFEKYHPEVIFSTDVQNEHDVSLLQDARRKKIKTVAMVRSWDNLSTRSLRILPDVLLVHNEYIAKEAVALDGMNPKKIKVTGVPHYDRYQAEPKISRREFLKKMGLDPAKKVIFYAPICDYRLSENTADRYILELLSRIDASTIVRFPPAETVGLGDFKKPANMTFDKPGHVFEERVVGNRDITPEDEERLFYEMKYADVVLCGPSTLALDAAWFDKPIVLVDLYPKNTPPEDRIYEYEGEHIMRVLESGAAKRVKTEQEFFRAIEYYFKHPEAERKERAALAHAHCGKKDGKASEWVVETLHQVAGR